MTKPTAEDISKLSRYFAIKSNDQFWTLSEKADITDQEKGQLLTLAFASLYHWEQVGTDQNIYLAMMSVARALTINQSPLGLDYARKVFDFFDGSGAGWIQAFTNAILSHALWLDGQRAEARKFYQQATSFQAKLQGEDRPIFDATFNLIPNPQN